MPDAITVTDPAELSPTPAAAAAADHSIDVDLSGFEALGLESGDPAVTNTAAAAAPETDGSPAPSGPGPQHSKPGGAAGTPKSNTVGGQKPAAPAGAAKAAPANGAPVQPVHNLARAAKMKELAPHLVPLMDRMSNAAFDHFFPIAMQLQNGELVSKVDAEKMVADKEAALTAQLSKARFYDHERGYELTDEYQDLRANVEHLGNEATFWAEQLENIANGQPWHTLMRDQNGQIRVSQPRDPKEAGATARVQSMLTKAHTLQTQQQGLLEALPTKHKEEYGKYAGFFQTLDNDLFGKLTNPNSKTFNKAFVDRSEQHLKQWPAMFRGRPEVKALANALAVGESLIAKINHLQAELTKAQNYGRAVVNGSPAPNTIEGGIQDEGSNETDAAVDALDRMAGMRL